MKKKSETYNSNGLRNTLLTTSSATVLPAAKRGGLSHAGLNSNQKATGANAFWAKCVRSVAVMAAVNAQVAPVFAMPPPPTLNVSDAYMPSFSYSPYGGAPGNLTTSYDLHGSVSSGTPPYTFSLVSTPNGESLGSNSGIFTYSTTPPLSSRQINFRVTDSATASGSAAIHFSQNIDLGGSGLTLTNADSGTFGMGFTNSSGSATLTLNFSSVQTLSQILSDSHGGTLGVSITGSGMATLAGSNTYTGPTTISSGTLNITGSIDSSSNIVNNSTLVFAQTANDTYRGNISGSGLLLQQGETGTTLTLAGNNTYTGATIIYPNKTLKITGSIDNSSNIVNNGGLVFSQSASDTYAHTISGSGSLTQNGFAILTLAGTNTYTGPTTISRGTLKITGSIDSSSNIVNNGNLLFNQSSQDTYAGIISGRGGLSQQGSGHLTLAGSNTYTGLTNILPDSYLDITGSIDSSSDIVINGELTFNQSADDTYSGNISGIGSIVQEGSNTITLAGSGSHFTGEIRLFSGRLNLANTNAVSSSATIGFHGGALQVGADVTLANATFSTNTTLDAGSHTLTLNGVSSGSGTLTIANSGSGAVVLAGSNTYSSGTILTAGTLSISSACNISSGTLTFNGGTLALGADVVLNQALALSSNSTINTQGHHLSLTGNITGGASLTITGGGAVSFANGQGSFASSTRGADFFTLQSGTRLLGGLPPTLFQTSAEATVPSGVGTINELLLPKTALLNVKAPIATLAVTGDNSSASYGGISVVTVSNNASTLQLNHPHALGSGGAGNILQLGQYTYLQCGSGLSSSASSASVLPQAIYYDTIATVNTSDGSNSHALATSGAITSTSSATSSLYIIGGGTFIPRSPYVGNGSDSFVVSGSGTTLVVQNDVAVPPTVALTDKTTVNLASGTHVTNLVVVIEPE